MPTRLLVVLSEDPPSDAEAYLTWNLAHLGVMVGLPGILSAQAFRIDGEFDERMGERPGVPRYRIMNVFEIDDDFRGPRPGTPLPEQPGGTGPNRPAPFVFVAVTEKIQEEQG